MCVCACVCVCECVCECVRRRVSAFVGGPPRDARPPSAAACAHARAEQRATSPKFVPRNYQLHAAIVAAERGDLRELEALCRVLARPFDEAPAGDAGGFGCGTRELVLEDPRGALGVPPRTEASREEAPWTGVGGARGGAAYTEPEPEWAQRRGVAVLS